MTVATVTTIVEDCKSSTIVVTVATVILALFTFGVDELFSKSISNILGILINSFN
ncbi:preprotein translocase subunit SecE [Chryseobacterium sp.]|uniref:preprotein translocase subunit SecE n=1 Tax=Chryseobacterium sp. TaxID=1871047 RepID=UPI002601AC53|nr:preprotein translocase subunit SecE [Chryseobacterium sp.]